MTHLQSQRHLLRLPLLLSHRPSCRSVSVPIFICRPTNSNSPPRLSAHAINDAVAEEARMAEEAEAAQSENLSGGHQDIAVEDKKKSASEKPPPSTVMQTPVKSSGIIATTSCRILRCLATSSCSSKSPLSLRILAIHPLPSF
jgi:hypothetical protein